MKIRILFLLLIASVAGVFSAGAQILTLEGKLFVKDRYIGKVTLMIEHESNGRDSIQSRSWNKVSLAGSILIDKTLMVHAKAWIPIIDGMNNKDILHYSGIFQTGIQLFSPNQRFSGAVTLTKRLGNFLIITRSSICRTASSSATISISSSSTTTATAKDCWNITSSTTRSASASS